MCFMRFPFRYLFRSESELAPNTRASGVLCHLTSLPSSFGIGDLGPTSHSFVDLLAEAKQRYWNILPLTPTRIRNGNSPYQPDSAFAGNVLLISPELLFEQGFLTSIDLERLMTKIASRVDYSIVTKSKQKMIDKAFHSFLSNKTQTREFDDFCNQNMEWIEDYALYKALEKNSDRPWSSWPKLLRDRNSKALAAKRGTLKVSVKREMFAQFLFSLQWRSLKKHCSQKKIQIIGDLPFYVGYESADVWTHPELFKLDSKKKPLVVSGVPPDYFSKHGQLWGNPVYRWQDDSLVIGWWIKRIAHGLRFVDELRLDHFRGFIASWQVHASEKTAQHGAWVRASSTKFFCSLADSFPSLPFIAEDLGSITASVKKALVDLQIPGMKILLFAFDGSLGNPHLPQNYTANSVVYTGNQDTNTALGWFKQEANVKQKDDLFRIVGRRVNSRDVSWELIKLAQASKANLSIIPAQDVLGLDSKARMNCPAQKWHNWEWQLTQKQLCSDRFEMLAEISESVDRGS